MCNENNDRKRWGGRTIESKSEIEFDYFKTFSATLNKLLIDV